MSLDAFLNSDAGTALEGLLLVAFLDFATGTFAALRDGTFALDAIGAFIRKHIFGRVAPIGLLLTVGYFGGAAGQVFLGGAVIAAGLYVTETAASIWGNVNPPKASDAETATNPATLVNPVPQD
jgi:hypothetical protein